MENQTPMKTSQQWWDSVKNSPEKIAKWLANQYHGELTASTRIKEIIAKHFDPESSAYKISMRIAADEDKHAEWIGALMTARGLTPEKLDKKERYWDAAMEDAPEGNGEYAAAIAAHAEEMRLERIKIIMADKEADKDISSTFAMIYKDEIFHAKAFKKISGDQYYNDTTNNHAKGLEALGLII